MKIFAVIAAVVAIAIAIFWYQLRQVNAEPFVSRIPDANAPTISDPPTLNKIATDAKIAAGIASTVVGAGSTLGIGGGSAAGGSSAAGAGAAIGLGTIAAVGTVAIYPWIVNKIYGPPNLLTLEEWNSASEEYKKYRCGNQAARMGVDTLSESIGRNVCEPYDRAADQFVTDQCAEFRRLYRIAPSAFIARYAESVGCDLRG